MEGLPDNLNRDTKAFGVFGVRKRGYSILGVKVNVCEKSNITSVVSVLHRVLPMSPATCLQRQHLQYIRHNTTTIPNTRRDLGLNHGRNERAQSAYSIKPLGYIAG